MSALPSARDRSGRQLPVSLILTALDLHAARAPRSSCRASAGRRSVFPVEERRATSQKRGPPDRIDMRRQTLRIEELRRDALHRLLPHRRAGDMALADEAVDDLVIERAALGWRRDRG